MDQTHQGHPSRRQVGGLILLFAVGALLGHLLRSPAPPDLLWAAPLAPSLGAGEVGLARKLAPAINLLLLEQEPPTYIPAVYNHQSSD